jgi:prevent-host-death family protein
MIKVTATQAEATFIALLDAVAAGEEIEITMRGRTVARLVPALSPHALRGKVSGVAISNGADDELFTTEVAWERS